MIPLRLLAIGTLVLGTVLLLADVPPAEGCAVARPANESVAIAAETAVIVWDEAAGVEHFIRRASFATQAKDFGFLVPTPERPDLGEANDEAFKALARLTEPRTVVQKRPSGGGGCNIGCASARKAGEAEAQVEVLDQKRIAGQDIAILKANDADKLGQWLQEHDYDFSPALRDWVRPYLEKKWIITASKIAREAAGSGHLTSNAVRMSFKTDRPFFPYSEPADQREPAAQPKAPAAPQGGPPQPPGQQRQHQARLLRVFFIGPVKVKGVLGDGKQVWPGKVAWSNTVAAEEREKLLELLGLPKDAPPATWRLTEFEDHSDPRPGTDDVFFSPADDQAPVERPPHVRYVAGNLDGLLTLAAASYFLVPCLVRAVRRRVGRHTPT
jgi:hypothetical protein